ncbi:MAG: transcriptional regulator [Bacteroidia bacterium]|nr:transcriptional regulator [Bacteroidia bacterium]
MKHLLDDINKAFENKIRLGIMSALMVNEALDFNSLKELLGVTDGNLASHLKTLEKAAYIKVSKQFIGRKPNTKYSATTSGKRAFEKHIKALENFLKNNRA